VPVISRYSCNECNFDLPSGWGGYIYAVDSVGQRIVCPHPCEFDTIHKVTGLEYQEAVNAGRTGFAQNCVCLDCLKQFDLDLQRDAVLCPTCSSPQVCSVRDITGKRCPRCKVGLIEEGSLVRWELDSDWEELPVPQVVKDLVQFQREWRISPTLQRAAEIADCFGEHNFFTVACRLLGWWEGDYFQKDTEQKDSCEMQKQWTWCKALPEVLKATPDLAELVVIRNWRCWFADGVPTEVRRGIKNYLRKHIKHSVVS
jgi:DNA-directed RNA polymerase subunit RPC12/RpoP